MLKHLTRIVLITLLLVLCIVYPFLPGEFDRLAMPLSTMAQAFGGVGLLLVPFGGVWLIYELRNRTRRKHNLPVKGRGYAFALVSMGAGLLVAAVVSLVAFATIGPSLALFVLAFWGYLFARLFSGMRQLKSAESQTFNFAPLYLVFIPVGMFVSQLTLAAPLTEFSRERAIAMSAEFIHDIEAYRETNGHYPASLLATWKDYYPSVVGVEKFHYDPEGEAYNLFFEQPRFLFDNIGTREFVVYNPLDKHKIISHTSWILLLSPTELETSQGWYEVHETAIPHWKYFWFD